MKRWLCKPCRRTLADAGAFGDDLRCPGCGQPCVLVGSDGSAADASVMSHEQFRQTILRAVPIAQRLAILAADECDGQPLMDVLVGHALFIVAMSGRAKLDPRQIMQMALFATETLAAPTAPTDSR